MGFFDKFFKKKQNNKALEDETFVMHPEASSLYELKKYMDVKLAFWGYISKKEYKPFMYRSLLQHHQRSISAKVRNCLYRREKIIRQNVLRVRKKQLNKAKGILEGL